jgi:hypothetical protein
MNKQKLMRYLLMKKEISMGLKLEPYQEKFFNEMETIYNSDPTVKAQIDLLISADSMRKTNQILSGNYHQEKFTPYVDEKVVPINQSVLPDTEVSGGGEIAPSQAETSKVLVKVASSRKAGFVDALVMALVTGFVGGVATTVIFILM